MNNQRLNFLMKKTIYYAKKGEGFVAPNPMVGCVIVKNNKIISTGYHHYFGGIHAEVDAINKLDSKQLKNASLFVNLIPCCHHGKTPPCVNLIIKSKIKNVYYGCDDQNPLIKNISIKKLQAAGINVYGPILEKECYELNKKFFYSIINHKPYFLWKYAISADGKIATHNKKSKWITDINSRNDSNKLRKQYMAIMVGINTILFDNPKLNYRLNDNKNFYGPIRIIVDTFLKTPLDSFVVLDSINTKTIILTNVNDTKKHSLYTKNKVEIIYIDKVVNDKYLDINECVQKLYDYGIQSILVEGGAELFGSLLKEKWCNEIIIYIGNVIIGGNNAFSPIGGMCLFNNIDECLRLKLKSCKVLKQDVKLHYLVERKEYA